MYNKTKNGKGVFEMESDAKLKNKVLWQGFLNMPGIINI